MSAPAPVDPGATADESVPPPRPLPSYVEPELPRASRAELQQLETRVGALLATDEAARLSALAQLDETDASWLPALAERFDQLASHSTRAALDVLARSIRERTREPRGARHPSRAAPERMDLLELCVRHPDRSSGYLRPLTEVLAYRRMFEAIGSAPAARRVVAVYLRFGEFLRSDTELALGRMGDAALAALIETTAHPEPSIAAWAKRQLEKMGKRVASEALEAPDPSQRADILLAYGRARDASTARLLIAFAASERAPIRLAARQAVALLGELGQRELRDAYQTTTGTSAPREWSWRRVAEELFAGFDGQRLSDLYASFREGRAAEARGDLNAARAAFDSVLGQDPLFERGELMVPVYLAFANERADSDPAAAALAARRAERLAPAGPLHDRALSVRYTLDASALARRGIVDESLLQRARTLDPGNLRAQALDAELNARQVDDRASFRRYVVALAILALTLVSLIGMAFRARLSRAGPLPPRP